MPNSYTNHEYGNLITHHYLMFAIICQAVAYVRLKTKKKFKLLAIKVVEVAYERWSFTRGSKEIDLTMKMLVAYDR